MGTLGGFGQIPQAKVAPHLHRIEAGKAFDAGYAAGLTLDLAQVAAALGSTGHSGRAGAG